MVFPHSVEEEVDFENAEVVESDVPVVTDMSIRTVPPYQSSPEDIAEWTALLKSLKATRDEPKREKQEPRTLGVVDAPLSTSPKRYATAAEAMGWNVQSLATLIWHPPVYQENDGKVRKDGSQVLAGQEKSPATEKVHLTLEAKHPAARLGFKGYWVDGRFSEAVIYDPVGLFEPLEHTYDPIAVKAGKNEVSTSVKRRQEQALKDAERWNAEYNDGELWMVHSKLVSANDDLDQWLDEWLDRLAPDAKRLTRKRKVEPMPEQTTDEDLLGGAEWSA